ncbi:TetR family transcriptional regulator [Acidisoma cellulosilytica]|uniref:TetR family transcriptional regulator n=1 Tax=Acidisoma cellulosilyticum TaxID=2802395 RepID=A0A963YYV2_9PROT|nr:TetR/AcrR family transcriptional regulator [Acidisoma cellulosilyticum]MCB8879550.1 TetR family transcriptional regulator [Acidisoma cellulosilyticum]
MSQKTNLTQARTAGRPRSFDMADAVNRAVLVFRERGYQAASIDVISRGTGLTVGSLYKAFRDKKDIFAAAFARYLEERQTTVTARLAGVETGRARIATLLDLYLEAASGAEGRRGCLVVASLAEASGLDATQRAALAEAIGANETRLCDLLREGQSDGSVRLDLDVPAAADVLLALLQGIRVLGKLREPRDRIGFIAMALKTLD